MFLFEKTKNHVALLSDAEVVARLRLFRSENVGPATFDRLLSRYGSAARALAALPDLARRGGRDIKICSPDDAAREIDKIENFGARLVFKGKEGYPPLLGEIQDAPPLLTVLGDTGLLARPALAVVGARNASLAGKKIAADFSRKIGQAGFVIVSGLARGIDAAAHTAALETGTIAVVAGGIDRLYPPEHEKLFRDIAEKGAIIAESPFGAEPVARLFPRRNRIVSGLSLGALVVEAAARSGSLITARLAAEQNREVFAVPGSPLDPRAEGTNGLLRDGAHVAAGAEDVIDVLRGLHLRPPSAFPFCDSVSNDRQEPAADEAAPDPSLRTTVLENLSPTPVPVDALIRAVGAPVQDVLTLLLELELAGRIERRAGNRVSLL